MNTRKIKKEIDFLKAMIGDSDVNGVRYFNRVLKMIKASKIPQIFKTQLIKELEDTSGMIE